MQVLDGSRGNNIYSISEQVVLVEPSDMCDPAGLKMDSKVCSLFPHYFAIMGILLGFNSAGSLLPY